MADSTREGCGRCSITTVVDATADESRDPLGRLSARLDAAAERFVYGDR